MKHLTKSIAILLFTIPLFQLSLSGGASLDNSSSKKLSTVIPADLIVSGVVSSAEDGFPLPGVNVLIKDTDRGTITDIDGKFQLDIPEDAILIFSFIGFDTQEIPVNGQSVINVVMQINAAQLDEVVVIGYGTVKKSDLTGSVSSIQADELIRSAPTSLDQALQGLAAGVKVTQVSGRPGGETSIRIRGSSSINAGNEPLYVVDGMLMNSDNSQTNAGGVAGSSLNGLASINPSEIQSIEILKDASATAMYGSRGANGVVLITTKRGKKGSSSVTLDTYYGIQEVQNSLELLNGEEFANYMNNYNLAAGFPLDPRYLVPENIGEGTDWQEAIFQSAPTFNAQLSFLGGSENTQYAVTGGYTSQEGIILNSDFNRYSFRTNLDQQVNDWLKVGSSVSLSHITSNGVLTGAQSPGTGVLLPGATASAVLFTPTLPVLDENGPGGYTFEDDRGRNIGNPVADALETDNISKNSRAIANFFATFLLPKGFNFKVSLGADAFSVKENRFVPNFLKRTEPNNGDAVVATVDGSTWLSEFTLNYDNSFSEDHQLNALVGYTMQGFDSERLFAFALDFNDNRTGYHNLGSALNPQPPANGETSWNIISYLGRANYVFKNKYLLTITGRLDGSSKFGVNNKYGFFPSASVAWKVHEEDFLKNVEFLSSLKLRTSFGILGNQEIAPYSSLSTVGPIGEGVFTNDEPYNGQEPLRYANPDLKWERTSQFDFGVDAEMLEGRIGMTADFYLKNTTNLLLFTPLPATSGFSGYLSNIGELKNMGIELSVNSHNTKGKFLWETGFNISFNKNEITKLVDGKDIFIPGVLLAPTGWSILREGESLGSFYGLQSDGIFQSDEEAQSSAVLRGQNAKAGDRRYKDIDGRDADGNLTGLPDGIIDEADRSIIGNANPDFTWSLMNQFSYDRFDLSVNIQGSQGNELVNAYLFEIGVLTSETNVLKEYYDNRWTPDNPSDEYQRLNPSDIRSFSDAQVEDASYLRIQNITLGYNFPQKWINKANMSNARCYISANNLFTLTDYRGYDPEVNAFGQNSLLQGIDYGGYPLSKSFIVGVQLGF